MVSKTSDNRTVEKEVHLLMAHRNDYGLIKGIISGYKTHTLVDIAAELCDLSSLSHKYPEKVLREVLDCVLLERKNRLNKDFEWTEENKARFLVINNQLLENGERGWLKALEAAAELEKLIERKEPFLNDYEIEVVMSAHPRIKGDTDEAVTAYLAEEKMRYMGARIGHSNYKHAISDGPENVPLVDRSMNWNGEHLRGGFDNDYICYLMHCLLDTHVWSFPDILSINIIWVDVVVTHQFYTNIPKWRTSNVTG